MNKVELIERITNGEDSYTQFKEQIISSKDLAKEFVAFSNAMGGVIIFGVADDGTIKGLDTQSIEQIGQLIGNVGQENIKPPIHPLSNNITIDGKRLVIVAIESGFSKPYKTSSGIYYTKSGADKKIMSDEELKRLFSEPKRLYADEEILSQTTIKNLNHQLFYIYLEKHNRDIFQELEDNKLDLETLLENELIMKKGSLTLSGNLIFGINPQRFTPLFYIDCCYFDGNEVFVDKYITKKRVLGTFEKLYEDSMSFVKSNLKSRQVEADFNSKGVLEIDERVLAELITNALIHRDYYINSSIKIFIFYNRVEIISPGKLTNSLTIENIKSGRSICRNPILDSICENILPYSGYGSGIQRVISINPNVEFINDIKLEQFKCIIPRVDSKN
jgi:predicted HTH transcriptional regulator